MNRDPLPRNIAASVRARLTQRARERKENVQLALTHYAIERLLYRLSVSPYQEQFVLKGAMLFRLWARTPYRTTRDLDLLGHGDPSRERVIAAFRDICTIGVGDDGVIFKPTTLRAEVARPEDEYTGIRLMLDAEIAGVRLPIQVDIGFGDVVKPAIQHIEYPSLLEMPMPRLRAYPPEAVVAEKFQALVALGIVNTRMKDFFDLWAISETFAFEGALLAGSLHATFERRATELPDEAPSALTTAFSDDPAKQAQWRGFLRRTALAMAPEPLPALLRRITEFVLPPAQAVRSRTAFGHHWKPGGPWIACK